jgi:hypothetical protein
MKFETQVSDIIVNISSQVWPPTMSYGRENVRKIHILVDFSAISSPILTI